MPKKGFFATLFDALAISLLFSLTYMSTGKEIKVACSVVAVFVVVLFFPLFLPSATTIPRRKRGVAEVGVAEEGVCCKIIFL